MTGAGNLDASDVAEKLAAIRRHVRIPVGVGFGIRDGATARRVARIADAVVIGSRIVQEMIDAPGDSAPARAEAVTREFRTAMDTVEALV